MAVFGGQDWFKGQGAEGQEAAPTLDNLMKKKAVKKPVVANAPVTFSLDELMKTEGQAPQTVQPYAQSAETVPPPTRAVAEPPAPPTDVPDPNAPAGWQYDFPEYNGEKYDFHGFISSTNSQAYSDIRKAYGTLIDRGTGTWDYQTLNGVKTYLDAQASKFSPTMVTQKDKKGNPLVTGYYDYYGHWVTTEDYSDINAARKKWQEFIDDPTKMPEADYGDVKRQIQDLLDAWNDPDYLANLEAQGINWVDTFLGYEPGGFQAEQARLRRLVGLGVEGQQGLSPEDRARMERDVALQMQDARESTAQMMAQLQAGGHGVEFFKQSEAIAGGLASAASKAYMAIEDSNYARQKTQWESLNKQWETLYTQGAMSMGQFIQAQQGQANQIMAALGAEIDTISAQFQADLAVWTAYSDNLYKDIVLTMEYHGLVSQIELNDYEQVMAPYYAELERRAVEAQEKANEHDIFDILGLIFLGFAMFV